MGQGGGNWMMKGKGWGSWGGGVDKGNGWGSGHWAYVVGFGVGNWGFVVELNVSVRCELNLSLWKSVPWNLMI